MADGVYRVAVVTPEERLVDADARSVVLRSSDGDLTVLDGHTPLVTDVVPGVVRIEPEEGDEIRLAVHGGYLQVETGAAEEGGPRSTRVTLLAGVAELAEQVDTERAERAKEQAAARVDELKSAGRATGDVDGQPEDPELAEAEASLRRAEVRLEVVGADG